MTRLEDWVCELKQRDVLTLAQAESLLLVRKWGADEARRLLVRAVTSGKLKADIRPELNRITGNPVAPVDPHLTTVATAALLEWLDSQKNPGNAAQETGIVLVQAGLIEDAGLAERAKLLPPVPLTAAEILSAGESNFIHVNEVLRRMCVVIPACDPSQAARLLHRAFRESGSAPDWITRDALNGVQPATGFDANRAQLYLQRIAGVDVLSAGLLGVAGYVMALQTGSSLSPEFGFYPRLIFGVLRESRLRIDIEHVPPAPEVRPQPRAEVATDVVVGSGIGDARLSRRERQIRAIERAADALDYQRNAIPTGGKKAIRERCKSEDVALFGTGDSSFNEAWKEASKAGRVSIRDREKFARR
ncbi:hypothetical protein VSR82_04180 [Burkholderia sp. JPY481]|uniref:hypothetical protein n=1 Tax=Paraburkholderia sp. JPY465 TaxID=3042285 RepID=UPI0031708F07